MSWLLDSANRPNSKNEDRRLTWESSNHIIFVLAVFDGHGGHPGGTIAPTTAMTSFGQFFQHYDGVCETWDPSVWQIQLNRLFRDTHDAIRQKFTDTIPNTYVDQHGVVRRNFSHETIHGGTTVTLSVVNKRYRYCITANVGDSDAFLIEPHRHVQLSADHKPSNHAEWVRIHGLRLGRYNPVLAYDVKHVYPEIFDEQGHRVQRFVDNPWGNGLSPANVRYEPGSYLVFPRPGYDGRDEQGRFLNTQLAMTRSLGDFSSHVVGVTCEPTITVTMLPATECAIVVASDGLWDCWRYEEFAYFVRQEHSTGAILARTHQKAVATFGKDIDDISVCVLRVPDPEPAQVHAPAIDMDFDPYEFGQELGKRYKRKHRRSRRKNKKMYLHI
jgi:serine/threonine protein phosphatase PrpC